MDDTTLVDQGKVAALDVTGDVRDLLQRLSTMCF